MVAIATDSPFAPYAERELLARYESATPEQTARGREWYRKARRECRRMARKYNRPLSQVAAVMAITSPDAQLKTNVRWTEEILRGDIYKGKPRMFGKYEQDQAPKVRAALSSNRPGQYATGPKVHAFYRAIMGDESELVIDRWAAFAAVGGDRTKVPRAKARRVIADAYRTAAEHVGESLRDFQAIVWVVTRESTPVDKRGKAVVPKLADIV